MKCILMNKNMPVVELELDDDTAIILKVMKTYQLDFLPVGIDAKTGIPNKKELNEWWFGKRIPASRSGIRTALEQLSIQHSEQLLLPCCGLSLSDQYWMKPVNSKLEWENINFFENDFSDDVGNILFGQPASKDIDLMSPCNTSDGWLKKKWKIEVIPLCRSQSTRCLERDYTKDLVVKIMCLTMCCWKMVLHTVCAKILSIPIRNW